MSRARARNFDAMIADPWDSDVPRRVIFRYSELVRCLRGYPTINPSGFYPSAPGANKSIAEFSLDLWTRGHERVGRVGGIYGITGKGL